MIARFKVYIGVIGCYFFRILALFGQLELGLFSSVSLLELAIAESQYNQNDCNAATDSKAQTKSEF